MIFDAPPIAGAVITHDCFFDLWVRFDVDTISVEVIEPDRTAKVASLQVTEVALAITEVVVAPVIKKIILLPASAPGFPNNSAGLKSLTTDRGLTVSLSQVVFAFKMDTTVGAQVLYEEVGPVPGFPYEGRVQAYWDGSEFKIYTFGLSPQTIPYNGSPTDWNEISIAYDGGGIQAKIDNATPSPNISLALSLVATVDQFLGTFHLPGYNTPGQFAMFRQFNSIRTYAQYHCENLTGSEAGALVITPFSEGVGSTSADLRNGLPYWTLADGAEWGGNYTC